MQSANSMVASKVSRLYTERCNILRILCMVWILLFHDRIHYGFAEKIPVLGPLVREGAIGCTVFFLLSGMGLRLGYHGLSISDGPGMKKYFKKRMISLFPVYFFMLLVALLFSYNTGSWTELLAILPLHLTGLQVLCYPRQIPYLFNSNWWFISVLLLLYILFPYINSLVNYLTAKGTVRLLIVSVLVSEYLYIVYILVNPDHIFNEYYTNPLLRIPEFVAGILLGNLILSGWKIRWQICAAGIVIFSCIAVALHWFLEEYLGMVNIFNLYNIAAIPLAIFAVFILVTEKPYVLPPVLRYLNTISMELYLSQSFTLMFLDWAMAKTLLQDPIKIQVVFLALSFVFANMLCFGLNRPVQRYLRKRWISPVR